MKNLFLGVLSLTFGIFYGQSEREVGEFSHLKVYDRISVEMIESDKNRVQILGDDQNIVEVVNKNGELKIRTKTTKFLQGKTIKAKVYYTNIRSIQASQGANISSSKEINAKKLSVVSNEGSIVNIATDVDFLEVKANSGAEVHITGEARIQDIVVNAGAVFKGAEVDAENTKITSNAGGMAEVYARDTVTATVRAGGSITIYGNPEHRDTKKVIGGNITFK